MVGVDFHFLILKSLTSGGPSGTGNRSPSSMLGSCPWASIKGRQERKVGGGFNRGGMVAGFKALHPGPLLVSFSSQLSAPGWF